ncbi:MAG TPA: acireductone synthase [Gemmatimonadaceae bacterium]
MRDSSSFDGVVLDIEGTTTPVSFVYDVLFPYARTHLDAYLAQVTGAPELDEVRNLLRNEWQKETDPTRPSGPWTDDTLPVFVEWLMERDRKSPGLKLLQGLIWQRGYDDGSLKGIVYADVRPALERWRRASKIIAIYSSGSVLAQHLIFGKSNDGDLTSLIDRYFDTGVGAKRSAESYARIATELKRPGSALLFISDVAAELDAATQAGFQTLLCVRGEGTPDSHYRTITSFDEIE